MFKAMAMLEDRPLLVFGLSDANVRELKKDITFVISFSDGEKCALPSPKSEKMVAFALNDETLESLEKGFEVNSSAFKVLIFQAKDEQTMHDMMKGFIDIQTKVAIEGFAPSDKPVSNN